VRPLKIDVQYVVEPNGVNCDEFKSLPLRGTFRQKYQIRNDQLLILFFSRIHPKKGLDLLIPAFAKTKITGTTLVIAGPSENDYRAHLDKMVQKYEIQDQVIFTGMLEGKERISALRDADVFVLPSYQENFGIAVVESLASGTPVIISDQVNIHDQITAAKVGGVVSTNIDALAEELARWLSDGKLRQEAARRARPFVQTQYDWQKIAQRWKERYAQLVTSA
jgi:glycosyltransferase involved in cell wall biosynthesis